MIRPLLQCDWIRFDEVPARRLAILRILIGGYTLLYLTRRFSMLSRIATTDAALFEPVGAASWLSEPLPPQLFVDIVVATLAANILFLSGWMYRCASPVFAALFLFVTCYRNSWTMIYHSQCIVVLHVIVLAASPAADAFSVDAYLAKKPSGGKTGPERHDPRSWHYGWAVWLISVITVMTYFLAGVAKVAGPLGWNWVHGTALRDQIAVDALRKELLGHSVSPLAFDLYHYVGLFTFLGITSLLLEIGAPLVMWNRRLSQVWCVAVWLMHWGIFMVMGIRFRYHLSGIIFASFFPLEKILQMGSLQGVRGDAKRS